MLVKEVPVPKKSIIRFRYSFICQGTSTKKQQSDLFGQTKRIISNKDQFNTSKNYCIL